MSLGDDPGHSSGYQTQGLNTNLQTRGYIEPAPHPACGLPLPPGEGHGGEGEICNSNAFHNHLNAT